MKLLLVHQSTDLYGSDRSFLSVVQGLRETYPEALIKVILPSSSGPLVQILRDINISIDVDPDGYLRKSFLKSPFLLIFNIMRSFIRYRGLSKHYDTIYINTVVSVAALFSARFFLKSFVHVRELPHGFSVFLFKAILLISNSSRIYNSLATKNAFNLSGSVIYNGVESPIFKRASQFNPDKSLKKKFLLVGRISEWKGQSFVVNCLKGFSTPIELLILGGCAPGREDLISSLICASKEIKNHNIKFVDFEPDVSYYYNWADFVIVPSVLPEPFGRVAVEAMSYGKPPVVADHGGLAEIVTNSNAGLRFIPSDCASFIFVLDRCVNMHSDEYFDRSNKCIDIFNSRFSDCSYKKNICDLFV